MLLRWIISEIQEFYIHLFLIIIWSIIKYFTQKKYFSKTFNSEFSYIEVWFSDKNSKPLKKEDKISITSVLN